MIAMPKTEKSAHSSHRNSISTASAAGGGTRSSTWSAKDDETLIAARASGLNWNQIAPKHFPSKSPNACRKRHERLMERQNAEQWDGVKLDVLARAYMEVRREMWSLLADKVGEKWKVVEQKCMEKGLKNLNQACRSAQKKNGTYDEYGDSGIGISDLEEEDDRLPQSNFTLSHGYSNQRVPSIQSIMNQCPMATYPNQAHSHHQASQ